MGSLGSKDSQSLQLTKRSNRSWREADVDDEDVLDPFAEIDDDFSGDADDLEANLLRDKRATLCASVADIIEVLQPGRGQEELKNACDELVSFECDEHVKLMNVQLGLFDSSRDLGLENHFVTSQGMLA
jgi:hypothetical protein